MRLIILLFLCLCICGVLSRSSRLSRSNEKCESVRPFFETLNVTVDEIKQKDLTTKNICGGQCCSKKAEERLQDHARTNFHSLIHHHSRVLQGHLARTADTVRETVTTLARQSENKTLNLFEQVYRSMSLLTRPSIRTLYQAMIDHVNLTTTIPDDVQQSQRMMLQEHLNNFFTQLFPIAYHHVVNPNNQDFTDKFKECLYESIDGIQPFGEIPKQISHSVSKSLEAMRVLIQALQFGETVLEKIDSNLFQSTSSHQILCNEGLLKMAYCPKCSGHSSVSACKGLCKNIVRGCLTEPASELDLAWSGYVEGVERLVVSIVGKADLGFNAEKAIKNLDAQISAAVMDAMKNGPALKEKVKKACGSYELKKSRSLSDFDNHSSPKEAGVTSGLMRSSNIEDRLSVTHTSNFRLDRPDPLQTQLGNFVASIVGSRTFYGTLADSICAEYPDTECWNGARIGEYTKAVVDSSLNAQKYNPEFNGINTTSYLNSNTSQLIDQLKHINKMIESRLSWDKDPNVYYSDQPELDGSGLTSGDGSDPPDGSSGSGQEPRITSEEPKVPEPETPKPPSSSASMMTKSIGLLSLLLLIYYVN